MELIALLAKYDAVLERHVEGARHNKKYFSSEIQNEFVQSLVSSVRKHILSYIKEANSDGLIVDETTDNSHIEQVSFVFRYAFNGDVHESFLLSKNIETIDATTLFDCLKETLDLLGLSLSQIRGQCYNGASNMIFRYNSVKIRVLAVNLKARYIHCAYHCLNLVLVDACKSSTK